MASKLLHGSQVSKVSTRWRLAQGLSSLVTLLQHMQAITFHHVHRKYNSLADFLTNSGVNSTLSLIKGSLQDPLDEQIKTKCLQLAHSSLLCPDAGDNSMETGAPKAIDTCPSPQTMTHADSHDSPCPESYSSDVPLSTIPDDTWYNLRLPGLNDVNTCGHHPAHERHQSMQDPLYTKDNPRVKSKHVSGVGSGSSS